MTRIQGEAERGEGGGEDDRPQRIGGREPDRPELEAPPAGERDGQTGSQDEPGTDPEPSHTAGRGRIRGTGHRVSLLVARRRLDWGPMQPGRTPGGPAAATLAVLVALAVPARATPPETFPRGSDPPDLLSVRVGPRTQARGDGDADPSGGTWPPVTCSAPTPTTARSVSTSATPWSTPAGPASSTSPTSGTTPTGRASWSSHVRANLGTGSSVELPFEGGRRVIRFPGRSIPEGIDRDELTLLVARRLAWEVSMWHEIASWYGYASVQFFPERLSAFTPEDLYSNLPRHRDRGRRGPRRRDVGRGGGPGAGPADRGAGPDLRRGSPGGAGVGGRHLVGLDPRHPRGRSRPAQARHARAADRAVAGAGSGPDRLPGDRAASGLGGGPGGGGARARRRAPRRLLPPRDRPRSGPPADLPPGSRDRGGPRGDHPGRFPVARGPGPGRLPGALRRPLRRPRRSPRPGRPHLRALPPRLATGRSRSPRAGPSISAACWRASASWRSSSRPGPRATTSRPGEWGAGRSRWWGRTPGEATSAPSSSTSTTTGTAATWWPGSPFSRSGRCSSASTATRTNGAGPSRPGSGPATRTAASAWARPWAPSCSTGRPGGARSAPSRSTSCGTPSGTGTRSSTSGGGSSPS